MVLGGALSSAFLHLFLLTVCQLSGEGGGMGCSAGRAWVEVGGGKWPLVWAACSSAR